MVPKLFNPKKTEHSAAQEGNRKHLNSEIREMTSALTHHLNNLHHFGKSTKPHHENEEEHGVRIITLTGSNTGATMQGELDEKSDEEDDKTFTTYTNSNFQAINNSIMYGGSYTCKDPGVHIETCMDYEANENREVKHGKKGKSKVRGSSRNDQASSDGSSD